MIAGRFLVNGRPSYVSLDADHIRWAPASSSPDTLSRKTRLVEFAQVIGFQTWPANLSSSTTTSNKWQTSPAKSKGLIKNLSIGNEHISTSPLAAPLASQQQQQQQQPITFHDHQQHQQPHATINKFKFYYSKQVDRARCKLKRATIRELPTSYHQSGTGIGANIDSDRNFNNQDTTGEVHLNNSNDIKNKKTFNKHKTLDVINGQASESSSTSLSQLCKHFEAQLNIRQTHDRRPKRLLIFINPYGGKGKAQHVYKTQVHKLLELAGVQSELVVTQHANHARQTLEDPQFNVDQYDGIVCVGGDGMFSELMNGILFRYNRDLISLGCNAPTVPQDNDNQNGRPTANSQCQTLDKVSSKHQHQNQANNEDDKQQQQQQPKQTNKPELGALRAALGGIGRSFYRPPIPVGIIGAGSTDANSFAFIGTNDPTTATINIILGNQISIDVCSVHSARDDHVLRFVSTFVAYGYFGDVIRESEELRWLGPSRYDVVGLNSLLKNRTYKGLVRALVSPEDGSPLSDERCRRGCKLCRHDEFTGRPATPLALATTNDDQNHEHRPQQMPAPPASLRLIERRGSFVGINAAVTACNCPQSKKGFSPSNHLANGCADLILVRPCSRLQYVHYLMRTGWSKKSAFDLNYVEAYRCRQFEFEAPTSQEEVDGDNEEPTGKLSSWNVDGEVMEEQSIRVKVNNRLLRVYGSGGKIE